MTNIRKTHIITGLVILGFTLLAACTPVLVGVTTQSPELLYTQAAATIGVQMTLQAGETAAAQLTQIALLPTNTETSVLPTATQEPPTATPTQAPPTPTSPPPTKTPVPCNLASFVKDVSIPDGTEFEPNAKFTKTWRLQNVGTCTWQKTYDLVFVSGDRMDGPAAGDINVTVKPGETVDLSVNLRSPGDQGKYTGYWMLRDDDGKLFGLGAAGDKAFWVNIQVIARKLIYIDMSEKYCEASWSSNAGALPCPGDTGSTSTGYVVRVNNPTLETGAVDNEPALFVRVDESAQGYIQGRFPAFKVKAGDRFQAIIGCGADNKNCLVRFELLYRIEGSNVQTLGAWEEKNDDRFARLDVDLSSLRDETVTFILRVSNSGSSNDDVAYWLHPRIVR